MANQLHIYTGNPSAGFLDGSTVSSGTELAPITITLDASKAEEKAVKCAVRCDSGYYVEDGVKISFVGTNKDKWKVAVDDGYEDEGAALKSADWQDTVTLPEVAGYNVTFWIKATSSADEKPTNDTSVDVQAEGLIVEANG